MQLCLEYNDKRNIILIMESTDCVNWYSFILFLSSSVPTWKHKSMGYIWDLYEILKKKEKTIKQKKYIKIIY
jgi:hypothetical protein